VLSSYVLRGDFDEFPEQLNALADGLGEAHLGDDPVLDVVEAAEEQVEVGRRSLETCPTEHRVDELVLTTNTRPHLIL